MKKMICAVSLSLLLCLPAITGTVRAEETEGTGERAVSADQIMAEVTASSFEEKPAMESVLYDVELELGNQSDTDVMEIKVKLLFLDENREEVYAGIHVYNGQDTPIKPEEEISFMVCGRAEYPETPAFVEAEVLEVISAEELPPIHLPQEGGFLYQEYDEEHLGKMAEEPPVKITLWIDRMGDRQEAELTDENDISQVVEAFLKIKVGKESELYVTDNYNGIVFTFADGEEVYLGLNLKDLEFPVYHGTRNYELEELEEFWDLMRAYTRA